MAAASACLPACPPLHEDGQGGWCSLLTVPLSLLAERLLFIALPTLAPGWHQDGRRDLRRCARCAYHSAGPSGVCAGAHGVAVQAGGCWAASAVLVLVGAECGLELTAWWCLQDLMVKEAAVAASRYAREGASSKTLPVLATNAPTVVASSPPMLCSGGRSATAGMMPPLTRRTNLRPPTSAAQLEASARLASLC